MNRRIFTGVGVAAMMAFLVGCDEIKFGGTLTVHDVMTFAQTGADRKGTVVVNPGQFQTKAILGVSGQEKQIKLKIKNNGDKETVVEINFDKDIETNDNFVLKADQIKQNFDLVGNIVTKVTRTPEETSNESCTYQTQEWVCRTSKSADTVAASTDKLAAKVEEAVLDFGKQYPGQYPYPGYPGQYYNPPVPSCHTVWVTRYGWQYVRFFYETTTKDITTTFVQPTKTLADYKGTSSETEKIYTYQSVCR